VLKAILSLPAQNSQIGGLSLRRLTDKCQIVTIMSPQRGALEMIRLLSLLLKRPTLSSPDL